MKRAFFSILCFILLWITGCASTPTFQNVAPGMTSKQVSQALGQPKDRTFRGKREKWAYPTEGKNTKVVVFENGRVVELLNVEAGSKDVMHVAGRTPQDRGSEYCTGSNNYGRFPEGGGCNLYGCWPAGGYCNGFGCSATGVCTVKGCPEKIASYKCKD